MEQALDEIRAGDQPALMTDPSGKPLAMVDETLQAFLAAKLEKRKRQPQQQSQADKLIAFLAASEAKDRREERRRERKQDAVLAAMVQSLTGRTFQFPADSEPSSQESPRTQRQKTSTEDQNQEEGSQDADSAHPH